MHSFLLALVNVLLLGPVDCLSFLLHHESGHIKYDLEQCTWCEHPGTKLSVRHLSISHPGFIQMIMGEEDLRGPRAQE